MSLAHKLQQRWYQKNTPAPLFLRPLEYLFKCIVKNKFARYQQGLMTSYRAPVPVVVVGNITVGGTGKTPMILWLIAHCRARGLKVGVVSRGYGAKPPQFPWRVRATDTPQVAGDEPLLLVQRTGVALVTSPKRNEAVQALLAEESFDIILSDDGMQHYALERDVEIVLVDAARGFGNAHCLPAGPLREPLERLATVDAVLFNGALEDSEQGFAFQLQPSSWINLITNERCTVEAFKVQGNVHAVAGIGNPQRFFNTIEQLNITAQTHAFADHVSFTQADFSFVGKDTVLMTEKDAVKCRSFAQSNWWYLAVDAKPTSAFIAWWDERLTQLIKASH
ncbi:tetraacyldisaccharide 4'-kinase [Pseudomonas sp. F1_0610]|uniref:tetraacyldisaccharide 4'-kinase n=1 Tax=Pseudomonas sp. F1_0610 TaxID=3114284 RepID=UPI0039C0E166